MSKNPAIQSLLDITAKAAGLTVENKHKGLCVKCGLDALPRCTTEAGRAEFGISGFCEPCWDALWKDDPEQPEEK